MGMIIPWCGEIGTGKIPPSSLKAHNVFPIHGLAVGVKKNFPLCGFAAQGEILFSPRLLSHSWGKHYVPFVTQGEFYSSPLVASPLEGKNPVPISPQKGIGTFPIG